MPVQLLPFLDEKIKALEQTEGMNAMRELVDQHKATESSVCPLCLRAEAMTSCSSHPTACEEQ